MKTETRQKIRSLSKWLGPALILGLIAGAFALLHHELHHYKIADIRESMQAIPVSKLAACFVLTAINYVILIGYDLIGIRSTGHPLPLKKVAFASFTGFVMSYNFGSLLGGAVRIRLYSSFGMSSAEIVRMMIAIGTTFWLGTFALAGTVFIVAPPPIPDTIQIAAVGIRTLGCFLVAIVVAALIASHFWKKPVHWRGHELAIPPLPTLLTQLAVAAADLMIAAASLYVVLSDSITLTYPQFLGVYLLAVVAIVVTHVPGGVGVLELTILTFAAGMSKQEVVAGLLAFRTIYYFIPLAAAFTLLVGYEIRLRAEQAQKVARRAGRILGGITPTIVSMGSLLTGAALMFSGATPGIHSRMQFIRHFVPLPAIEVSHFLASLIGGALLILSRGLQRRLDSAWWGAVVLLATAIVLSLVKGLDYEEAAIAGVTLTALVVTRHRFHRRGSIVHPSWSPSWIVIVGIALLCTVWLALFTYQHAEPYSHELWWQFAFDSHVPRLLRALVGVTTLLLGFTAWHLISGRVRVTWQPVAADQLNEVATIVSNSTRISANLALLGDKLLLFNEQHSSFIMYGVQGRSWISMGDPVGPEETWNELLWQFREACDRYDSWPVFYQVEAESLPLYLDHGFSMLKLGEEARVRVPEFSLEGGSRKGLRQNRSRFQKESFTLEILPAGGVAPLLPELKSISDAWLAEKHAAEKRFSLGFFDETYLQRFPCAVIRQQDQILAFTNLWLGAEKEEFSIDLMRHRPGSQRGTMDFLFVELLLWGQAQGFQWFNLGMAPLSGIEARQLSPLWNKFASLIYERGNRFYGFEGLRDYKEKFDPIWSPKYLAARGGLALPRILTDVTLLIGRKR